MKKRKSDEHLIQMANQIATYFESQTQASAAEETAKHINGVWSPRMRERLINMINANDPDIHSTVVAAESLIRLVKEQRVL